MSAIGIHRSVLAPVTDRFIRTTLDHGLRVLGFDALPIEIGVRFVGPMQMRALNRDRRGLDVPTDVISLPLLTSSELQKLHKPTKSKLPILLGDLIICPSVACQRAVKEGVDIDAKYAWLLTHGLLHLAGYDHEQSPRAAQIMEDLEQQILGQKLP